MDNLPALVQALPPELYNEIYELTFTAQSSTQSSALSSAPSSGDRFINQSYKPPSCLQVDCASREKFAKSYYGKGSTFYVPEDLVIKWLKHLPRLHVRQIREIRCTEEPPIDPLFFEQIRQAKMSLLCKLFMHLDSVDVAGDAVKLEVIRDVAPRWMNYSQLLDELFD